jgi:hypothetical protein
LSGVDDVSTVNVLVAESQVNTPSPLTVSVIVISVSIVQVSGVKPQLALNSKSSFALPYVCA